MIENKFEESLGFYRFEYDNGMIQTKELITKKSFEWYKFLTNLKSDEEVKIKGKKKNKINPEDLATLNEATEMILSFHIPTL